MIMRVFTAICVASLGLALSSCGNQLSENSQSSSLFCPGEKESSCASAQLLGSSEAPRLFCFRTVIRDEMLGNDPGASYGVEVSEEVRKSRDLLNGTGLEKRRTCSRAFVMQDGKKKYLENDRVPGSFYVTDVKAEKDYLLMAGQTGEKSTLAAQIVQLRLSQGIRTKLAEEATPLGGCSPTLEAHASPSGVYIAQMKIFMPCGSEPTRNDVTVKIFSDLALPIGPAWSDSFTPGVYLQWTNDSIFTLQDNERTVSRSVSE